VDCAVDAATAQQRRIGGVDKGIDVQCGDVTDDDFQPRLAYVARGQG